MLLHLCFIFMLVWSHEGVSLLFWDCLFQSYSKENSFLSLVFSPGSIRFSSLWLSLLLWNKQVFLSATTLPVDALIRVISGSSRHSVRHLIISMNVMSSNLGLYPLNFVHPCSRFYLALFSYQLSPLWSSMDELMQSYSICYLGS